MLKTLWINIRLGRKVRKALFLEISIINKEVRTSPKFLTKRYLELRSFLQIEFWLTLIYSRLHPKM